MGRLTRHYGSMVGIIGCSTVYPNEERKRANLQTAIVRLTAYEDTGLEPKQILKISNIFRQFGAEYNCGFDFVADFVCKYAQAEEEGRLVVLPCKKGDVLYSYTSGDITGIFKLTVESVIVMDGRILIRTGRYGEHDAKEIGKTLFRSHEEAEAALANKKIKTTK